MPYRSIYPPIASARLPRVFFSLPPIARSWPSFQLNVAFIHSTPSFRDEASSQNHYEILQINPNATPVEVKKSFYALSKTHHPDRNPSDPAASQRFVKISEAYATLSTPAKRQEYDRSLSLHSHSHQHHHHRPQGSYHSSGPAGGRPASGLSKRRTQFHGPPPSFYRSGGWGEQSSKRRAESEKAEASGGGGGMGHGQSPWFEENDVPHFDREGHLRTQRRVSHERIYRRRKGEQEVGTSERENGLLPSFLLVGSILGLGILVPSLVLEGVGGKKKGREER